VSVEGLEVDDDVGEFRHGVGVRALWLGVSSGNRE
jgi:hypothetical protein